MKATARELEPLAGETTLPIHLPLLPFRRASWTIDTEGFPESWPEVARRRWTPEGYLIPFGDIHEGEDGSLCIGLYNHNKGATFIYRSHDDGKTWLRERAPMDKDAIVHEPALFHLGEGKWLAAARTSGLDLYVSDNNARIWTLRKKSLTGSLQYPGHFTRLNDGTLLLSHGNRNFPKGVDVRFSDDDGATWSGPFRVVDFQGDGGYPDSIQLADGRVLTAYYSKNIEGHAGYHMGVVIWDPTMTRGR